MQQVTVKMSEYEAEKIKSVLGIIDHTPDEQLREHYTNSQICVVRKLAERIPEPSWSVAAAGELHKAR